MRWLSTALIGLMTMTLVPGTARAAERPVFAQAPVSEALLADTRGGQTPFASLTAGAAYHLADADARSFFRVGSTARIEMDNWWGSTGSELIATSVRAAAR